MTNILLKKRYIYIPMAIIAAFLVLSMWAVSANAQTVVSGIWRRVNYLMIPSPTSLRIVEGGRRLATSTANSTATLTAADFINYSHIAITPTSGNLTLTLPASSTISQIAPGNSVEIRIENKSTAATTTTISAGTGITIFNATSTLVIPAGKSAIIKIYRDLDNSFDAFFDLFI